MAFINKNPNLIYEQILPPPPENLNKNRSYNDNDVEPGASYSYFVRAYNSLSNKVSSASNSINVTAPNPPNGVLTFEAILNSSNEVELRWTNDNSQYIMETTVNKHVIGGGINDYQLLGSFEPNVHHYMDHDITPGTTIHYQISHVTDLGVGDTPSVSDPKYDFVKVPYRDISQPSPVYINKIKFTSAYNHLEAGWFSGEPEFYITVSSVNPVTHESFIIQQRMFFHFDNEDHISQEFDGRKVFDWMPGYWYDMISFHMIEVDEPSGDITITATAKYKMKNEDKDGFAINGAVDVEFVIPAHGEDCGNGYLTYYENPEKWVQLSSYGAQILVSESD